MSNKIKQVIVMRTDLGMRKGKMIAQGAHASLAFLTSPLREKPNLFKRVWRWFWGNRVHLTSVERQWIESSFAKICVRVDSEEHLLLVKKWAEEDGLKVHLITDSGLTEFHGVPTNTCLAIGPDLSSKIDSVTGDLKLL